MQKIVLVETSLSSQQRHEMPVYPYVEQYKLNVKIRPWYTPSAPKHVVENEMAIMHSDV